MDSVIALTDANQAFIAVEGFKTGKRSVSAKLTIWVNQAQGPVKKSVTVKNGDDLFQLSNQREIYRNGFIVNEIDAGEGFVTFANDVRVGQSPAWCTDRRDLAFADRGHGAPPFREGEKAAPDGHQGAVGLLHRPGGELLGVWRRRRHYQGQVRPVVRGNLCAVPGQEEFAGLMTADVAKVHNGYFSQDIPPISTNCAFLT
ncbi:MAG: hypothetical protein U5L74_02820 [Ideonella sp.]|nr:hypothetical protein [Ideonella sp.]